jgi:hypothetical protein
MLQNAHIKLKRNNGLFSGLFAPYVGVVTKA